MVNIVGIDVGSRYTKVIESDKKLHLLDAFMFETPYTTSETQASEIDITSFLKQFTSHIPLTRLKISKIAINLPLGSITMIIFVLPRMAKNELATAAINEAKRKMIPASGPQHIFEYSLLGEKIVAKITRYEVMVIRTEKVYIQKILDLFKDIDSTPVLITPSCCALVNAMPQEFWKKDASVAFSDIGSDYINISIAKEAKLYFSRNVAYGSRDIINDISRQLGISVEEAERLIKEKGVPEVDFDLSNRVAVSEEIMRQKFGMGLDTGQIESKKEVNLLELRMLWQSHIERIIQELRRSLAFYKEQSEGARVEYIYFLGGGSQVKNLITILSSQIGGECQTLLPFRGMQISKDGKVGDGVFSNPIFVNAANLALNVLEKDRFARVINFLPLELKRKEVVLARRFVLRITGILLIFLFSLATLHTLIDQRSIKINISGIDFKLNRVKVVTERLNYLSEQATGINQRSAQIAEVLKTRKDFLLPLQDLAKILPREILLTNLTISKGGESKAGEMRGVGVHGGLESSQASLGLESGLSPAGGAEKAKYQIKIEAQIFSTYERAVNIIQEFKKRLESINYFTNINITPIKLEKISAQDLRQTEDLTLPGLRKFTLTAELK